MKILNFGSCNIDYVYSLDHIVAEGETETTERLETFPGGKGLNQSVALAKAGAKVYHAGCVGEDGGMLTSVLAENGVDISLIKAVEGKNGHAIIQVSKEGKNSIFLYPGSNEMVSKEYVDSVLENFEKGDVILLQNEISNIKYIVETAYKKGMSIFLNPSPFNEKVEELNFDMLSCIVLNEVEAKAISGLDGVSENVSYFRERFPKLRVMLTLGENGCVYFDKSSEIKQNAFRVKAVDTTAAGDTFTGYFITGLSAGVPIETVLKTASAASAISVSRMGAAPSIPLMEEVAGAVLSMEENISDSKEERILKSTERYISENLASANLSGLAEVLGYSAVYSGTLVKKITGKSFSALVQEKRCEFAAKMLTETEKPICDIIGIAGYENESFFRKKFFDKYGVNPLEYRKKRR